MNTQEYLDKSLDESISSKRKFLEKHRTQLSEAAKKVAQCINAGGKILIFGNGGSAADAQHMAAEMVGHLTMERRPLPAIALTTDTSGITAIANDYSYADVFSRQVEALAHPGDVLVAISTSGNSKNVLNAVELGSKLALTTIGLTGGNGGELKHKVNISLNVSDADNSMRIQETHIFAIHCLVDMLDRFYLEKR